jgi:hypothetical protein
MSENGRISPPLVPNQALYQAEPQPEMEYYSRVRGRCATYFAYFSADGKEIESLPELRRLKGSEFLRT